MSNRVKQQWNQNLPINGKVLTFLWLFFSFLSQSYAIESLENLKEYELPEHFQKEIFQKSRYRDLIVDSNHTLWILTNQALFSLSLHPLRLQKHTLNSEHPNPEWRQMQAFGKWIVIVSDQQAIKYHPYKRKLEVFEDWKGLAKDGKTLLLSKVEDGVVWVKNQKLFLLDAFESIVRPTSLKLHLLRNDLISWDAQNRYFVYGRGHEVIAKHFNPQYKITKSYSAYTKSAIQDLKVTGQEVLVISQDQIKAFDPQLKEKQSSRVAHGHRIVATKVLQTTQEDERRSLQHYLLDKKVIETYSQDGQWLKSYYAPLGRVKKLQAFSATRQFFVLILDEKLRVFPYSLSHEKSFQAQERGNKEKRKL